MISQSITDILCYRYIVTTTHITQDNIKPKKPRYTTKILSHSNKTTEYPKSTLSATPNHAVGYRIDEDKKVWDIPGLSKRYKDPDSDSDDDDPIKL